MCLVLWEPQGKKDTLVKSIIREGFKEEVSFGILTLAIGRKKGNDV